MASDRSSPRAQCHLQPLRQSRRTAARRSGLPHRTPGPGDLRRNPRHRLTSASTWYRPPTDGVWQLAGISQQGERLKPPDDGGLAVVQGGQTACRRRWVGLDDGAAGGGRRERRPVILVGWRPDCYPSQRGVEVVTDRRIVCGRGRGSRRACHLSGGANCRETAVNSVVKPDTSTASRVFAAAEKPWAGSVFGRPVGSSTGSHRTILVDGPGRMGGRV